VESLVRNPLDQRASPGTNRLAESESFRPGRGQSADEPYLPFRRHTRLSRAVADSAYTMKSVPYSFLRRSRALKTRETEEVAVCYESFAFSLQSCLTTC
jgi:hypothetical protein